MSDDPEIQEEIIMLMESKDGFPIEQPKQGRGIGLVLEPSILLNLEWSCKVILLQEDNLNDVLMNLTRSRLSQRIVYSSCSLPTKPLWWWKEMRMIMQPGPNERLES